MTHASPYFRLTALLVTTGLIAAGCGSNDDTADPASKPDDASGSVAGEALDVVVGFYPLEFATSRIVGDGDNITVETLTSPGVEPHDVELTPQAVAGAQAADLLVYSSGLQPAVDQAVESQASEHAYDVNEAADLSITTDEGVDPHFWLDPDRMANVSQAIADRLAELDPANEQTYQDNADSLVEDLAELDEEFTTGLASCESTDVVTTHEAFGYLAERYDLKVIGITGLAPEAEPSPARLAEVTAIVEETGVDAVYAEVLIGENIAQTVADETGTQVLTLDPVEGITDASPGSDYFEVMRANLAALQEGQNCS